MELDLRFWRWFKKNRDPEWTDTIEVPDIETRKPKIRRKKMNYKTKGAYGKCHK